MSADLAVPKKTRNLPNLTECHACGFRVDVNDGKNRLNILYSEWRVVLLCKKCLVRVESAQICSYCFGESSGERFKCSKCKRSIHKVCFLNRKTSAPWSYSCVGSEFSICVDCWIPKSVETSRRVLQNSRMKKKPEFCLENQNYGVSDGCQKSKSLEDVVKDAKNDAEKKFVVTTRARGEAVEKALEARRLASNAVSIVGGKEDKDTAAMNEKEGVNNLVDNVEFALQLHRAINGSPRKSKNRCILNTSCNTNLKTLEANNKWSTITYSRRPRALGRSKLFKDSNTCENLGKDSSELPVAVNALDRDSSTDANCLSMNSKVDMGTGALYEDFHADHDADGVPIMKEGEGSWSNKLVNSCAEGSCAEFSHKQDSFTAVRKEIFFFLKYKRKGIR